MFKLNSLPAFRFILLNLHVVLLFIKTYNVVIYYIPIAMLILYFYNRSFRRLLKNVNKISAMKVSNIKNTK